MHGPVHPPNPCAGLSHLPVHIDIPGVTPEVPKPTTSAGHGLKVEAMVILHLHSPNIVIPLNTSTLDEGPQNKFVDDEGKEHASLTAAEMVKQLEQHLLPAIPRRHSRPPILMMDLDSAHYSKLTRKFCEAQGIHATYLPAHSPDLSPLDSHMFGVARNRYQREHPTPDASWSIRSRRFLEILRDVDSLAHITSWDKKLDGVVKARGYRARKSR